MKLVYLLSVAAIATATTLNASAFDADLKGKNENQLKATVMQERRAINQLRARGVAQPHHAHLRNGHADVTDTDILLETIGTADCDPYVQAAKAKIDAVIEPWVEAIMPGAGNFFVAQVDPDGHGPQNIHAGGNIAIAGTNYPRVADRTKDAFKAALHGIVAALDYATLNAVHTSGGAPDIGVPLNGKRAQINKVANAVYDAINELFAEWVNDLDVGTDPARLGAVDLLENAVANPHVDIDGIRYPTPASQSDEDFRAALTAMIFAAIENR